MNAVVLHGPGASVEKQSMVSAASSGRREAVQFEATLLAVLFDQALAQGGAAFGPGLGGDFARSQLSQELARSLAASGGIGLARVVEESLGKASDRGGAFEARGR